MSHWAKRNGKPLGPRFLYFILCTSCTWLRRNVHSLPSSLAIAITQDHSRSRRLLSWRLPPFHFACTATYFTLLVFLQFRMKLHRSFCQCFLIKCLCWRLQRGHRWYSQEQCILSVTVSHITKYSRHATSLEGIHPESTAASQIEAVSFWSRWGIVRSCENASIRSSHGPTWPKRDQLKCARLLVKLAA